MMSRLDHRLAAANRGMPRAVVTSPKADGLKKHRHLHAKRVLHQDDVERSALRQKMVQDWMKLAA